MMRAHHPVLLVLGGLAVLAASFFVALFLLRNGIWIPGDDPAEQLARFNARDVSELEQAAAQAGLRKSDAIVGWIETTSRQPDGTLRVSGWAADGTGDGSPMLVVVLANGKVLLRMSTKGTRNDVQQVLRGMNFRPEVVGRDVFAEGTSSQRISCGEMKTVLIIGVNNKGQFRGLPGSPAQGC